MSDARRRNVSLFLDYQVDGKVHTAQFTVTVR